jgi:hypothetical protein
MKFHLLPDRIRKLIGVESPLQILDRFGDAAIVKLDALARDALDFRPLSALEQRFCIAARFPEQTIVAVEPVECALRDQERQLLLRLCSTLVIENQIREESWLFGFIEKLAADEHAPDLRGAGADFV